MLNNKHYNFGGDAIMNVNSYIRLTSEMPSMSGWLWSKEPIDLRAWQVEFEFKVAHSNPMSGDGFAFWFSPEKETVGPVFGNKDYFTGLGLLFDTYQNSRARGFSPYIMAMVGDGRKKYDHEFDGKNSELAGCPKEFRNRDKATKVRIKYVEKQYLKVEISQEQGVWTDCFNAPNVELPPKGYFGFSAMTGDITSSHDIISIDAWRIDDAATSSSSSSSNANVNSNANGNANNQYQSTYKPAKSGSSWSPLMWILVFILFSIVAYVVWVLYNASSSRSSKRF